MYEIGYIEVYRLFSSDCIFFFDCVCLDHQTFILFIVFVCMRPSYYMISKPPFHHLCTQPPLLIFTRGTLNHQTQLCTVTMATKYLSLFPFSFMSSLILNLKMFTFPNVLIHCIKTVGAPHSCFAMDWNGRVKYKVVSRHTRDRIQLVRTLVGYFFKEIDDFHSRSIVLGCVTLCSFLQR